MIAAHNTGLSANCSILNAKVLTTNELSPVDTDEDVSVIPRDSNNLAAANAEAVWAANGTSIHTYEHCSFKFDLGLNRTFRWVLVVAGVPYPFYGKDFSQHLEMVVEARHRKTVNRQASQIVTGS